MVIKEFAAFVDYDDQRWFIVPNFHYGKSRWWSLRESQDGGLEGNYISGFMVKNCSSMNELIGKFLYLDIGMDSRKSLKILELFWEKYAETENVGIW
jgi:hypothetical protein